MSTTHQTRNPANQWTSPRRFADLRDAQDFADQLEELGYLVSYERLGGEREVPLHEVSWTRLPRVNVVEFGSRQPRMGPREKLDVASARDEQAVFGPVVTCLLIGMISGFLWREIVRFCLAQMR